MRAGAAAWRVTGLGRAVLGAGALAALGAGCTDPEPMTAGQACRDVGYAVANAYARCAEDPGPGDEAWNAFQAAYGCELESAEAQAQAAARGATDTYLGVYTSCVAEALALPCAEVEARAPDAQAWVAGCEPRSHLHRSCRFFLDRLGGHYFNCMAGSPAEISRTFLDQFTCVAQGAPDPVLDRLCTDAIVAVDCAEVQQRPAVSAEWLRGCEGRFAGGPSVSPPSDPGLTGGLP